MADGGESSFQQQTLERLSSLKAFTTTNFSRAKQFTFERLGKADTTEYDSEYQSLCDELDKIKLATERLMQFTAYMLEPNPTHRIGEAVYRTFDRAQPTQANPFENLGLEMSRAGKAFGPETQYGGYLVRCGEVEFKIGTSWKLFRDRVQKEFTTPLKAFLEVDVKNALSERKITGTRRLDLDAARAKARSAKPEKLPAAEDELRKAQAEFDGQLEKTRSKIKTIVQTHVNHLGHLRSLIDAQKAFYTECLSQLTDVEVSPSTDMGMPTMSQELDLPPRSGIKVEFRGLLLDRSTGRQARVLYDYTAMNEDELTVVAGMSVEALTIPGNDDFYVVIVGDGDAELIGKVKATHLDML